MTIGSDWRAEAPDLIQTELRKRLPSGCKIIEVEPDSFFHNEREIRYVTVVFEGVHPASDSQRLLDIESVIYNKLWERGFDPVPGIDYLREGKNVG